MFGWSGRWGVFLWVGIACWAQRFSYPCLYCRAIHVYTDGDEAVVVRHDVEAVGENYREGRINGGLEQRRLGDAFSLKAFHDTLLRNGSLPISFHRRLLAGEGR